MKLVDYVPVSCEVVYFGELLSLLEGECYVAADRDGKLYAYKKRPLLRPDDEARGEWSIQRSHPLPRFIGHADLEEVNWKDSIGDFTLDAKFELVSR